MNIFRFDSFLFVCVSQTVRQGTTGVSLGAELIGYLSIPGYWCLYVDCM